MLRWSLRPSEGSSLGRHVDLQHGPVRGGRHHGGRGGRLPDSPGSSEQEEEAGVPEAAK